MLVIRVLLSNKPDSHPKRPESQAGQPVRVPKKGKNDINKPTFFCRIRILFAIF